MQHCHSTLKNGEMFQINHAVARGVCIVSQFGHVIFTKTDEGSQTTAKRLLLGITLTEIDERPWRCLVKERSRLIPPQRIVTRIILEFFWVYVLASINKFDCPVHYFHCPGTPGTA